MTKVPDISEQKRNEVELLVSRRRFHTLFENLADCYVEAGTDFMLTHVSENVERIFGYRNHEAIGRSAFEFIVPEERRLVEQKLTEMVATRVPIRDFDVTILAKNGDRLLCTIKAYPNYDQEGRPVGVCGLISDVTEQYIMLRMLEQSERRLKDLLEGVSTGVAIYECVDECGDYVIRYFNSAAEKIDRLERSRVLNKKVTDVLPAVREMGLLDVFSRVCRTGNPERFQTSLYLDGRIEGWRENYVFRLNTGEIVVAYTDQTDIRIAQEELKRSEEKYRQLFEEIQSGFALHEIITDDEGEPIDYRFIEINSAFELITGLTRNSLIGRRVLEAIPQIEPFWIETYGKVALTGESTHFEHFDAAMRKWYDVIAYSPEPRMFAVIFSDISERKRIEENLIQTAKLSALGRITAGMAHELNQPLNAIKSFCQEVLLNLRDGVEMSTAEIIESLSYADDQVNRMSEIILTMKSFAAGGIDSEMVETDVNELLSFPILNHRIKQIERRGGRFTIRKHDAPLFVNLSVRKIQQVFTNVLLNALDAVDCPMERTPEIIVSATQSDDLRHAVIVVEDNGHGIAKEKLEMIFEPFFTTKDPDKGTGLGLAISQDIITKHGGEIEAMNTVHGGALFRIKLPLVV